MNLIRLFILFVAFMAVDPLSAKSIPTENLDADIRSKVMRYVEARDSFLILLGELEQTYTGGDHSPELLTRMDKRLDKIAELDAVIDYLTLDIPNSSAKEICIVARKLINTLRSTLACRLLESTEAMTQPFAMNYVGVHYYHEGKIAEAMDLFRRAAEADYPPAIHNVAVAIYENSEMFGGTDYSRKKIKMAEDYLVHPLVKSDNPLYTPPFSRPEYIVPDMWYRVTDGVIRGSFLKREILKLSAK